MHTSITYDSIRTTYTSWTVVNQIKSPNCSQCLRTRADKPWKKSVNCRNMLIATRQWVSTTPITMWSTAIHLNSYSRLTLDLTLKVKCSEARSTLVRQISVIDFSTSNLEKVFSMSSRSERKISNCRIRIWMRLRSSWGFSPKAKMTHQRFNRKATKDL